MKIPVTVKNRKDGDIRHEVRIRIRKTGTVFRKMGKVWSEDSMSLRIKLKLLLCSTVLSVLTYGCESWKNLRGIEEQVRRFKSGCLRKFMKIIWYDMVS